MLSIVYGIPLRKQMSELFISFMRCSACNEQIAEVFLDIVGENETLCEECYSISIGLADEDSLK